MSVTNSVYTTGALVCTLLFTSPCVAQGTSATYLDYRTTAPAAWTTRAPASSMRLAEFTTPGAAGKAGAEVIVYFFGKGAGGSPDANLNRWKSQFSNPTGAPVKENVSVDSKGPFPLTIAEYSGTYARGIGAGSEPEQARPEHMLVAVVTETPHGTLFFQLFGPIASVESQRAAYLAFVRGLK